MIYTLYYYVGLVVVWVVAIALALLIAGTIIFFLCVALRRSWLFDAYDVLRTWYYYDYTRKIKPTKKGLQWVLSEIKRKGHWNPFNNWWFRFIDRHIVALKRAEEVCNEDENL